MKSFKAFLWCKPSLGQSWLLVALIFVGSLLTGIALPHASLSLSYLLMMLLPLAFCWWLGSEAMLSGAGPVPINAPDFGKLPAWAFLLLSAVALLALSVVIEPATEAIPMPDSVKAIFERLFLNSALWDIVLSTCILAPLLEELLCRGMMLRGMHSRGMAPWKAIFWSAFLFALMHMNPWQSIPALLIGIFLGWVYWRTRCLWATIFLHCFNNSVSTVISRLYPDLSIDAGLNDILPPTVYWTVYGVSFLLLILILYLLHEKTLSPEIQTRLEA